MNAHAGAMPTSAEELAQKHQKLLQEYSRLKAQHTVLKKGLIKEQSTTASLQGNVKEKEKELRKLQEQLDLLAFHNERLTKRIESVQEGDQKGSHFSLLGGAVKKELEKSTQALDAANIDLAKKIEENERLHEELSENRHIYTEHVNGLHLQIANFEKRIEELQVEISTMQKDRRDQAAGLKQEKTALQTELTNLKNELAEKTKLLNDQESNIKEDDAELRSEIESLRAILLAKLGDIEGREEAEPPSLFQAVPACEALRVLEEQAKNYIYALREQTSLKGLPHEIAAKIKTSSETWSEQTKALAKRVEESEARTKELLESKQHGDSKSAEQMAALEKTIEQLRVELKEQNDNERIAHLEQENARLEEQIQKQVNDLKSAQEELDAARSTNERLDKEAKEAMAAAEAAKEAATAATAASSKTTDDKETQANLSPKPDTKQLPEGQDEEEESFVYQSTSKAQDEQNPSTQQNEDDEDEEDDEVFVYRGQDAPEDSSSPVDGTAEQELPIKESTASNGEASHEEQQQQQQQQQTNGIAKTESPECRAREVELAASYESQIRQLTDKLQLADSKAVRFSKMVDTLKDRLDAEVEEKHGLIGETERLAKELNKTQELLDTTEKNYQEQLRDMTEQYIAQIQQAQR
ncbi:hypothetical protein BDB00DRAFT_852439 [Zychaea mexicana]|uniref:uncharacterized protein n=1 Tax=Zychaea mexicana TaxID=64656 RepID=UPI0022FE22C3|nr:uncharacterized protein BDB00DRAFT_852439 [Zychaea mexicana]KAI9484976.1 hypothetical protein BDB00DRAFT_852439 [Zychaea mexicana]